MMAGYIIYVKLPGKRFAPTGGGALVVNKIHADIFTVNTNADLEKLNERVAEIEENNKGYKAELRPVKGW